MPRAAAVANEFLDLARNDAGCGPIDQMKLQKLIFYAHAWWLASEGRDLIPEDIEAWPWGPVVRDIYYQTTNFGRQPVAGKLRALDADGEWTHPMMTIAEEKRHVKEVWDIHKSLSGIQLSNATHMPGEPWTIVSNKVGGNLSEKPVIPNDLIMRVFKEKFRTGN